MEKSIFTEHEILILINARKQPSDIPQLVNEILYLRSLIKLYADWVNPIAPGNPNEPIESIIARLEQGLKPESK